MFRWYFGHAILLLLFPMISHFMQVYNFVVVIEQDEDGLYLAKVPDLPGCHTQAKTLPLLHSRIKEAIELYLEVQQSKKIPILQKKFVGIEQVEVTI